MNAPLDLLALRDVLTAAERAELLARLRAAAARPATVIDPTPQGRLMAQVRRTRRLDLDAETEALVRHHLEALRGRLEAHFGQVLGGLETPQALRYEPGDFFVAHQDGNTPMIHDRSRHRRVSLSLLLSEAADYSGGALVFHGPDERRAIEVAAGDAIAFRAETTHEVLPVETGERYSIAAWWLAPDPA